MPVQTSSFGVAFSANGTGSATAAVSAAARAVTHNGTSRRNGRTASRSSKRLLGAGLIAVPELPSADPELAIMAEPRVPDHKRFCAHCDNALSREKGFCGKCGRKYSFMPSLQPGDLIAGQYQVKGALAYGGLGWIYLAFDQTLSRYVVLKGLLNSEDEGSAAVAIAERQFLAAVKHSNIVGIYNFVKHGAEGFIVMEYVGGKTLRDIRKTRGPLPAGEAVAYIHRILGAFGYLHRLGLVYCDFKPDNVMLEGSDVKLIDLGGVRRLDDPQGDIYGTVGYSAPEAGEGPTVVSDLYTIGRTLAVLLLEIKGFSREHRYSLPAPEEAFVLAQYDSLYRFLLRATHQNADERFQSADEMADQLLGVLREISALESGTPRPAASVEFCGDLLAIAPGSLDPVPADIQHLPVPNPDPMDAAFSTVLSAKALPDLGRRATALEAVRKQFPQSMEALLRLAAVRAEIGQFELAETLLREAAERDAWDWRVYWFRGLLRIAEKQPKEAMAQFNKVYSELPGETAPKLGLAMAAELAGERIAALRMYDLVSRLDPAYVTAAFGLARCRLRTGDRAGAVEALQRVPASSSQYMRAQVETIRALIDIDYGAPSYDELQRAAEILEGLPLERGEQLQLRRGLLETAVRLVQSNKVRANAAFRLLGQPFDERPLREGLEESLRALARLATGDEKLRLVEEANRVRPRTWI